MTIPSWARRGAKVVCWRCPTDGVRVAFADNPTVGAIYTLDRVDIGLNGIAAASLMEMNCILPDGEEFGYELAAFRPLVDDTNDNEIEAQIYHKRVRQNGAPVKELEPAE